MAKRQRESIARHLYDLSKILFATTVVGNLIAWPRFNVVTFLLGGMHGTLALWWAYVLDGVTE